MKSKNLMKITATLISLTGIIVAVGFGCGLSFQPVGEMDAPTIGGSLGGVNTGSGVVVVAGTKTLMIPINNNLYPTYLNALQVTNPSNQTIQELNRQRGSFSATGETTTINSAFVFAATSLGAAVCLDRINFENTAGNEKLFFNNINLAAGPNNNVTDANIRDVTNRLFRAVANRNETPEELAIITAGVNESMAADTANNATETREAMLYLCTLVLASTSGYEL